MGDGWSDAVSNSFVIVGSPLARHAICTIIIVCTVQSVTSMRASFGGDFVCRNMTSGRFGQVRGKKYRRKILTEYYFIF